jgi:hypothetical protein
MRAIHHYLYMGEPLLKKLLRILDRGGGNRRVEQALRDEDADIPDSAIQARGGRDCSREKEDYGYECPAGDTGNGECSLSGERKNKGLYWGSGFYIASPECRGSLSQTEKLFNSEKRESLSYSGGRRASKKSQAA